MIRKSRLLVLGIAIALAITALADWAGAAGKVTVQVIQILATEEKPGPKDVDPELAELKSQLEKSFTKYHKFRKLHQESKTGADGETLSFALRSDFSMTVVPGEAPEKNFVKLQVTIRNKEGHEKMATTLKLKNGGSVVFGKEFEAGDGHLLIALTVKRD